MISLVVPASAGATKKAYVLATTIAKAEACNGVDNNNHNNYVSSRKFRLMFLRSDNFHVPKAGGTSIRYNLERTSGVEYMFATGRGKYNMYSSRVTAYATRGIRRLDPQPVKLLEVHAGDNLPFLELRRQLQEWRTNATNLGINFFTFKDR